MKHFHSCARFWKIKVGCPFMDFEEHEDSMEDEGLSVEMAAAIQVGAVGADVGSAGLGAEVVNAIAATVPRAILIGVIDAIAVGSEVPGFGKVIIPGGGSGPTREEMQGFNQHVEPIPGGGSTGPTRDEMEGFGPPSQEDGSGGLAQLAALLGAVTVATHMVSSARGSSGGEKGARQVERAVKTTITRIQGAAAPTTPTPKGLPKAAIIRGSYGAPIGAGGRFFNSITRLGFSRAPGDFKINISDPRVEPDHPSFWV